MSGNRNQQTSGHYSDPESKSSNTTKISKEKTKENTELNNVVGEITSIEEIKEEKKEEKKETTSSKPQVKELVKEGNKEELKEEETPLKPKEKSILPDGRRIANEDDVSSGPSDKEEEEEIIEIDTDEYFNRGQQFGQVMVGYQGSATPFYLFGQFIPVDKVPSPHSGMLEVAGYPVNGIIGNVLMPLVTKENPLSGLKAEGGGSIGKGVVKEVTTTALALGVVVAAGYGITLLSAKFMPNALASTNSHWQQFGEVMSDSAFRGPIEGTVGYFGYMGIKALGMKLWEYIWPSKPENVNPNAKLYLVQTGGQYLLSMFNDVTLAEATLFYVARFGKEAIAADPRIQAAVVLGGHAALGLLKHLSFEMHPIESLALTRKPSTQTTLVIDEEVGENKKSKPSAKAQAVGGGVRMLWNLGLLAVGYGICDMTCSMAALPDERKENNLPNRMMHYALALSPLAFDFTMRHVAPRVVEVAKPVASQCWKSTSNGLSSASNAASKCWSSLFSSNASRVGYTAISANDEDLDNSNTTTNTNCFGFGNKGKK